MSFNLKSTLFFIFFCIHVLTLAQDRDVLQFPPLQPSTQAELRAVRHKKIGELVNGIQNILDSAGYNDKSYFILEADSVFDFAIVTRMERTDEDGKTFNKSLRWSTEKRFLSNSFFDYIKALFKGRKYFYRYFIFYFSKIPYSLSSNSSSDNVDPNLYSKGYSSLPSLIENLQLTGGSLRVLVYEFEATDYSEITFNKESRLNAINHLKKAGIYDKLINEL